MMQEFLIIWGQLLLIALVMPFVGSALISAVTKRTNQVLVNRLGNRAQYYFSFFGIIIHELSHAAMALIFRHKIDQISLVQKGDENQKLGYVSHAWNPKSFYQRLGNFFIGMGPIFGIGLAMWGVTYFCWPQLIEAIQYRSLAGLWFDITWWKFGIGLVLTIQFCLALNLSDADWQNVRSGVVSYAGLISVIAIPVFLMVRGTNELWNVFGRYGLYFFVIMFSLSLVIDIMFNFIFKD